MDVHFTNEKTEAQGRYINGLMSHSLQVEEPDLESLKSMLSPFAKLTHKTSVSHQRLLSLPCLHKHKIHNQFHQLSPCFHYI